MTNNTIAKFCALTAGILSLPVASYAGQEVKETKEVIEKCKESCITGDLGVNIASQYISRGIVYENQGSIIEPYADLYFKLYEGEGFLNKVTLNLGEWNSFHSHKSTGVGPGLQIDKSASTVRWWFETDFMAGVSFTFLKNFTITPSYYVFTSPNDAFQTFQGLNVKLAYDDTDLLGKFALHPYVQYLRELENKIGSGITEGDYWEFGIAPSAPIGPVTLTFPLTLGLGGGACYVDQQRAAHQAALATGVSGVKDGENVTYGFFSAGVTASYTLKFIPECYGTWTASAGYTYYNLGEGTAWVGTQQAGGTIRNGNSNEHVFQGGIMVAF